MKFQFNLQTGTLKLVGADRFLVLPKEQQFTAPYGSTGFRLDPNQPNHWIIFSLCREQVQVFYKIPQKDDSITYYQRELTRPTSGVIEVEFSKWDRITKKTQLGQNPNTFNKGSEQSEQ